MNDHYEVLVNWMGQWSVFLTVTSCLRHFNLARLLFASSVTRASFDVISFSILHLFAILLRLLKYMYMYKLCFTVLKTLRHKKPASKAGTVYTCIFHLYMYMYM